MTWGRLDLPHEQHQVDAVWDPVTDGHFVLVGAPRAGATSALRTLLGRLLTRTATHRVHAYVVDGGTGLRVLRDAPDVGAWVAVDDTVRVSRVLHRLVQTLEERQTALAAAGLTSFAEQQELATPWPLVTWCVDGWGRFRETQERATHGTGLEAAHRLLAEGPAVGIVALLAGDRGLLTGRVTGSLPTVWALRLTDPTDLMLTGLRPAQVPRHMPPGRVVEARSGRVAQVAVLGDEGDGAGQVTRLAALAARTSGSDPAEGPWHVRDLPERVLLSELVPGRPGPGPSGAGAGVLIGRGGDEAEAVSLPLHTGRLEAVVVLGARRSGRSTALRTVAAAARAGGAAVVLVTGPAALPAVEALGGVRGGVVCVDDADAPMDPTTEEAVLAWARDPAAHGGLLVVSAESAHAAGAYRGLLPFAARSRTGLLLGPHATGEATALGISHPVPCPRLPGRGVLVLGGDLVPVQVALSDLGSGPGP